MSTHTEVFPGRTHEQTAYSGLPQPQDCGAQRNWNNPGWSAPFEQACRTVHVTRSSSQNALWFLRSHVRLDIKTLQLPCGHFRYRHGHIRAHMHEHMHTQANRHAQAHTGAYVHLHTQDHTHTLGMGHM